MTVKWVVRQGDCIELMRTTLPDNYVDAIVTDPPYGLGFMGKKWDALPPGKEWADECFRVLKPGGHLLAFGGTRTYHRLVVAIEDAGFEIRDCLAWMYGQGFPKSLDVSKAIDKASGAERPIIGVNPRAAQQTAHGTAAYGDYNGASKNLTSPATDDSREWEGWGTALKPAFEPIVVARKPLSESTVAANVLEHGTGAINVDGCRIGAEGGTTGATKGDTPGLSLHGSVDGSLNGSRGNPVPGLGRWPANVVLDDEAAALLDEQTGELGLSVGGSRGHGGLFPLGAQPDVKPGYGDRGGASRFFYVAKTSKKERNAGLEGFESKQKKGSTGAGLGNSLGSCPEHGQGLPSGSLVYACGCPQVYVPGESENRKTQQNIHPTVKPIALMRWLVRLVTPPGGRVLDPFTGSGTTGIAAVLEGFNFGGFELEPEYVEIAQARITHWLAEEPATVSPEGGA